MRRLVRACALLFLLPATAWAQTGNTGTPSPESSASPCRQERLAWDTPAIAMVPAGDPAAAPAAAPEHDIQRRGAFTSFVFDVGRDFRAWFTSDTARTLTYGTAAALAARPADEPLSDRGLSELDAVLDAGDDYGNLLLQVPLGAAWWAIGHAAGSGRAAAAGRDLLRAQISAVSWTYAIKYSVQRTRPNGEARSFPSGHVSSAFATASVVQGHYGWKIGLPFYALGVYTAASRIHDRKHWLSDTLMGATVGMAAGRAVTVRLRQRTVQVTPAVVRGGAMLQFVVVPTASGGP